MPVETIQERVHVVPGYFELPLVGEKVKNGVDIDTFAKGEGDGLSLCF